MLILLVQRILQIILIWWELLQANNDVPIVSEALGKVIKVYAQVGDFKKSGSTFIQLEDDVELAAFKTAEVNYLKAQKDYERYQAFWRKICY